LSKIEKDQERLQVFMTRRQVQEALGRSRSSIYDMMKRGLLARPVRSGSKAVRWLQSDIVALQKAAIAQRDANA
jgi:prophage regulatory protein